MMRRTTLCALLAALLLAVGCATPYEGPGAEEPLHEAPAVEEAAVEPLEVEEEAAPGEAVAEESAEEEAEAEQQEQVTYPQFRIDAEIFVDGRSVSRPQIITLADRPVQITQDRSGERVLAVELAVHQKECGGLHLTGEVLTRSRLVHRIDNHMASGDILDLALVIDTQAYEISLKTTLVEQS